MSSCNFCKKSIGFGKNVSHSKRRTNRHFKLNLKKIKTGGTTKHICTSCLKKMSELK